MQTAPSGRVQFEGLFQGAGQSLRETAPVQTTIISRYQDLYAVGMQRTVALGHRRCICKPHLPGIYQTGPSVLHHADVPKHESR